MKITVDRYLSDHDATLSKVSIDGNFECYGLEDEYRSVKKHGETRIPAGTYNVGLRTVGGFHNKYKTKFADFHQGMLHVQNVPGFEYILIHLGNYDEDTKGCLLLGSGKVETEGKKMVTASKVAYQKFYPKVIEAAKQGNLTIEYLDNDRDGASEPASTAAAKPAPSSAKRTYVVQSGEGLAAIAKKNNTTVDALKKANASKLKTWGSVQGFNAGETVVIS